MKNYLLNILLYPLRGVMLVGYSLMLILYSYLINKRNSPVIQKMYQKWSRLFFNFFGVKEQLHFHGSGNLPKQFILIANHPAGVDVVWLPSVFKVTPLSKEEIKDWPLIGKVTRSAGVIFVKRDNLKSKNASLVACKKAAEEGKNILIFPEGGCFGKYLQPFRPGAFRLSMETGLPIVPAYLYYEDEDVYEWGDIPAVKYIWRLLFLPQNRKAHLYIFEPFYPKDFKDAGSYKQQVQQQYLVWEKEYGYKKSEPVM